MARILVVDDEIGIRELLSEILYDEGHTVDLAENATQAREYRLKVRPDLVLLDIWMPDTDGVSLLKEWGSQNLLDMPVVMMSGHATIDTAVEATKIGALDFLEKPITLQRLLAAVHSALDRGRLTQTSRSSAAPSGIRPAIEPSRVESASAPVSSAGELSPVPMMEPENSAAFKLRNLLLDQPLRDVRDEFERVYFQYHLSKENGSMTRVAEKTGLERTHLYRKLKQLGIELVRRREG